LIRTLLTTVPDAREGWVGRWSPGIGDPTVVGWVTVGAYLLAGWLCWRVFRRLGALDERPRGEGVRAAAMVLTLVLAVFAPQRRVVTIPSRDRFRTLWLLLAACLLFLGINKQLDLQTALTEWGRGIAVSEGLYQVRRPLQLVFIAAVVVGGLVALRAVLLLARGGSGLRPVIGGVVFLACFVVIRATSFHHVDLLLGHELGNVRVNWLIELGGIAFIAAGAYRQGLAVPSGAAP
jgi:hypothetical protein